MPLIAVIGNISPIFIFSQKVLPCLLQMEQLAAPLAEQEPKAEDGGSGGSGLGNRGKFES